jgi:superfamily II RNA helicase
MTLQETSLNEIVVKEYESTLKTFETLELPSAEYLKVIQKEEFFNQNFLSLKDRKVYLKQTAPWIKENSEKYESAKTYNIAKLKLAKLSLTLDNFKVKHLNYILKRVNFLYEHEYLNLNSIELKKENITVKGLLLKEVNEVNPIMLTELVFSDYLIDLDFPDIISILALFLDLTGESRDVSWSFKAHQVKKKYLQDMDALEVKENTNICDWKTNDYLCDVSKMWVTQELGPDLHPILKHYYIEDLFPGEFVRMMLKLNNICKEVVKLAFICNKDYLIKKLDNCELSIVRGIVTPQSLYVSGFKV